MGHGLRLTPDQLKAHQRSLLPATTAATAPAAKRSGDSWENELRRLHKGYQDRGRAVVLEFAHPYRVLGRGGRCYRCKAEMQRKAGDRCVACGARGNLQAGEFRGRLSGKGPPDLVVLVGRWAWLLDAKTSSSDRWPLSHLKPHQADAFDAWEQQAAGRSGILLRLTGCPGHPRFLVPWAKLGPVWRKWKRVQDLGHKAKSGTASLSLADARTLGGAFDADGWLHLVVSRSV